MPTFLFNEKRANLSSCHKGSTWFEPGMVWLISGLLSRVFAPESGPDAAGTPLEKRAQPEARRAFAFPYK